jgi:hypothetical protein
VPHLCRKPRLWLAACALLAVAACLACLSHPAEGGCGPQPQSVTSPPPTPLAQPAPTASDTPPPVFRGQAPDATGPRTPIQTTPPAPAYAPLPPAAPPTLEQLLDRLAAVKAQKEQLEKQEKTLADEIRKKLAEQQQRLKKLGVTPKNEPAPTPAQTGALFFNHPF